MTRAGYVALLGRPNVGKSTLLNRMLGQKISITSSKPQTTRHQILGIHTLPDTQIVYVDTPGLHLKARKAMNRYLNRTASQALGYVDVVVWLVEALRWTEEEDYILEALQEFAGPVLLVLNKVDRVRDKPALLPFIQAVSAKREFAEVIPLSALRRDNLAALEQSLARLLPEGEFLFDESQITTVSQRFLAAEVVREKLMRELRDELPYRLAVEVESFEETERLIRIRALIWVERPGQKAIVVGANGATLKRIGSLARQDLERMLDSPVFLQTWVKVRDGWSDNERALQSLGYT